MFKILEKILEKGLSLLFQQSLIKMHIPQHLVPSVLSDPVGTGTDVFTAGHS